MIVQVAKLRMSALRQGGAALFHVEHVRRSYRVRRKATVAGGGQLPGLFLAG